MRHHEMCCEDQRLVFGATDATAGYGVLAVLLVLVGGSLLWWWPGVPGEVVAPWTRRAWTHLGVLGYAMLLAIVAGLVVVAGGYLSDRGRRHDIEFDTGERSCTIRECWRGIELVVQMGFGRFSSFEVHRPVGPDEVWQLGAVLKNGSYWRLDRNESREELEEVARRLNERIGAEEVGVADDVECSDDVDIKREDDRLVIRWDNRERTSTRLLMLAASMLFSAALLAPVLLMYAGGYAALVGAVAVGTVLLAVPLFAPWSARSSWPFVLGWFAVTAGAVGWLGAHWAYFPIATVGLAIFVNSAVAIVQGLWRGEPHSITVDEDAKIYEDGQLLEEGEQVVVIDELEAAISNVTEERPPTMKLVPAGGGAANTARHLNREYPEDVTLSEPVELEMPGLSLFELAAVSMIVDDEIRQRTNAGAGP